MTGKRYRTPAQFRADIGTGTTAFKSEWIDFAHSQINLYEYHEVVPDEHGRR